MPLYLNGTEGVYGVNGTNSTPANRGSDTNTGIVYGTDTVQIATGGTTAVTVDSSQNVGIGTASPAVKLDVQAANAGNAFKLTSTTGTNNCYQTINNTGGTFYIGLDSSTGATFANAYSANLYHSGAYPMIFWTSGAERMRINANGQVNIGATNENAALGVNAASGTVPLIVARNTSSSGNAAGMQCTLPTSGNNTSSYHFWGNTSAVGNWYLYGNGTMSYTSDQRLKKNIETTRDGYLEDLCRLRVVKYNWKNDENSKPKELGLIAQEVAEIFPSLIQDDVNKISDDDEVVYKQLKASVIPYMLLKAIQELSAKLDAAEARIAALEAK